jgi:hypothetical protein
MRKCGKSLLASLLQKGGREWVPFAKGGILTGYSVGKVRVPAGISNRLPADVMLSIDLLFHGWQTKQDTIL